ncbi:peptidoglycan editing factor PgeF [Pelagibacterium lentulum]|uniref:Purine nucleoside phosphorylase n=1 Tax=Pelagibacterium lentulum TaxID=2029865 RepID=A0A916R8Z9_9HYPH|nr:peptidoglycan editing factor PgeF [Pelagibacterium lentulum]GGA45157.1 laccase domain protein [Pelagibacterium lentulum]
MHAPLEQSPALNQIRSIRHGFFGRRGGVSEGEFAALNASISVGDDSGNVAENIHRAVMALKAGPLPVAMAKQVHGTDVLTIRAGHDFKARPEADALVTDQPGIALGILTADCVPILLADPESGIIGAAHAGWRGAVGNILAATVNAMAELGAGVEDIVVAIGPSISAPAYEVGDTFAQMIREQFPHTSDFLATKGYEKPHFDVPGLVRHQAEDLGLATFEQVGGCTYHSPELYFSHRHATHSGTRAGRQISLIAKS